MRAVVLDTPIETSHRNSVNIAIEIPPKDIVRVLNMVNYPARNEVGNGQTNMSTNS